eukprot:7146-Heterococcus_DN1.PRE.1
MEYSTVSLVDYSTVSDRLQELHTCDVLVVLLYYRISHLHVQKSANVSQCGAKRAVAMCVYVSRQLQCNQILAYELLKLTRPITTQKTSSITANTTTATSTDVMPDCAVAKAVRGCELTACIAAHRRYKLCDHDKTMMYNMRMLIKRYKRLGSVGDHSRSQAVPPFVYQEVRDLVDTWKVNC